MSKYFRDWLRTLGAPEDPVATDTSSPWSAMSLLKGVLAKINDGTLASTLADSAIRASAMSFMSQGQLYVRRARVQAAAAAVSATTATTQADTATASAALAEGFAQGAQGAISQVVHFLKLAKLQVAVSSGYASVAQDAANRAAGYALTIGRQRQLAAETSVLAVQVYS